MKIQQITSDNGKGAVIRCDAPIGNETSVELKQFTENLINRGIQYIIFDASQVEHISAEGLTLIANLHRKLRSQQGLFVISCINN